MRTICGAVYWTWHTLGKQLCRAVQLSRLVANIDGTAVQLKDGISGSDSIQRRPDGHERIPVSGLQITQTQQMQTVTLRCFKSSTPR